MIFNRKKKQDDSCLKIATEVTNLIRGTQEGRICWEHVPEKTWLATLGDLTVILVDSDDKYIIRCDNNGQVWPKIEWFPAISDLIYAVKKQQNQ